MNTYNVSLDLQIVIKSKQECILSCCRKTKKVALFMQKDGKTVYAEISKEHAIIGEPEFCDLITNAGKLDKVSGDWIAPDNPMYFRV